MHTALIVNPAARRATAAVAAAQAACTSGGLPVPVVLETTPSEPGGSQARYAVSRGAGRVVVVGGDGTLRAVAQALVTGNRDRLPTLGMIPTGSANLFARTARLPLRDLKAAARIAILGAPQPTDAGLGELTGAGSQMGRHVFLMVAGLGHDAVALATITKFAKRRLGWVAYFVAGARRWHQPGSRMDVSLDGVLMLRQEPVWSLLAVNAVRLPIGVHLAPRATLSDGRLSVAVLSPGTLPGWARAARVAFSKDGLGQGAGQVVEVAVEPKPPGVLAQLDGDLVPAPGGALRRATFTVVKGALQVARP